MRTPKWFLKKSTIAYILLPLSFLYYFITKSVYFCRLFNQKTSKRPVICIGNIFAGGVGKTPIVMEIAKRLSVPVVMRGYKKNKNKHDIGDEAKMLMSSGIVVYTGNRAKNIEQLNKYKNKNHIITPVIMDDGFQNPTVKKDISILVFDESIGFGNGFLIPSGPLREPVSAIQRADAVIIIKAKNPNKDFKIRSKKPVFYAKSKTILPKDCSRFIVFAGIGYPDKFFNALNKKPIKAISFSDHHQYTDADLKKLFAEAKSKNAKLLTTEKDWVRLPKYAKDKIQFAKQEISIDSNFWIWIGGKINGNF